MEIKNNDKLKEILKTRHIKKDLMIVLGVDERTVRAIISDLAVNEPIIATSNRAGYKLAVDINDADGVDHELKDLDSRIRRLEARKKPLMAFNERVKGRK